MPATPINQIRNNPLVGRLLSDGVARPLPTDADWSGGVSFLPSCGGARGSYGCAETFAGPDKNQSESPSAVSFDTFLAYHQSQCDGVTDRDAASAAAITAYTRLQSAIWAGELYESIVGNADLKNTAVDITPMLGPEGLKASLIGLVDQEVQCGIVDVLLHAPIKALPAFLAEELVVFSGGRYLLGGIPVSFDLYGDAGPAGEPDAAANEAWIWATGPVEWAARAAETNVDLIWRQNKSTITVEQAGILRFDPCCVNAVRATIC